MSRNNPPSELSQYLNDNPRILRLDGPVLFRDSTNRLVYVYKGWGLGRQLDENRHRIRAVIVLGHVEMIPSNAFMGCSRLEVVEFQNPCKIHRIGSAAFQECISLREIDLSSVRYIDDYAFCDCIELRHVTFGRRLVTIGQCAFFYCYSLGSVIIPRVQYIKKESFRRCHGLTSVELPEEIRSIDEYAFSGCRQLGHLIMPSITGSYNVIQPNAFFGCNQISQVDLRLPNKLIPYVGDEVIADISCITDVFRATVRNKTAAMRFWSKKVNDSCCEHIERHLHLMDIAEWSMARIVLLTLDDRIDIEYIWQHLKGDFGIVKIVTHQVLSFLQLPDSLEFTANGVRGEYYRLHRNGIIIRSRYY